MRLLLFLSASALLLSLVSAAAAHAPVPGAIVDRRQTTREDIVARALDAVAAVKRQDPSSGPYPYCDENRSYTHFARVADAVGAGYIGVDPASETPQPDEESCLRLCTIAATCSFVLYKPDFDSDPNNCWLFKRIDRLNAAPGYTLFVYDESCNYAIATYGDGVEKYTCCEKDVP